MALSYTKKLFIERVRNHMANGWPDSEFNISENEVLLYIDSAIAASLVGSVMGKNKVTGVMETPEAYIVNTHLTDLVQNQITGEWETTLPQTPLSLSLGLSISNLYFSDITNGQSQPIWLIKSKRNAFREYMPKPTGVSARVINGNKIALKSSDGGSLFGLPIFVDMVSTRTSNVNDSMALPDDVIQTVFDAVVVRCKDRLGIPRDIIKDDVGQGATNVRP